jgi:hypothetical protein
MMSERPSGCNINPQLIDYILTVSIVGSKPTIPAPKSPKATQFIGNTGRICKGSNTLLRVAKSHAPLLA